MTETSTRLRLDKAAAAAAAAAAKMFSSPGSSRRGSTGYRSARAVRRQGDWGHSSTKAVQWWRTKLVLVSVGAVTMAMMTMLPVVLLEQGQGPSGGGNSTHHSLHSVVSHSYQEMQVDNEHDKAEAYERKACIL